MGKEINNFKNEPNLFVIIFYIMLCVIRGLYANILEQYKTILFPTNYFWSIDSVQMQYELKKQEKYRLGLTTKTITVIFFLGVYNKNSLIIVT